jgi:hypothetical protein
MKDRLYLLRPGFVNAGLGPLYCSDSTPIEGMLSFFPKLRDLIEVSYLEFPRPRASLVELLGESHQSLPVLVLATGRKLKDRDLEPESVNGQRILADERKIRQYLSTQYDLPHAS